MSGRSYGSSPAGEQAVDLVLRVYEAFARREMEAVMPLLAPDVHVDVPVTAQLAGRTGPYVGHDGMRRYLADVERLWEDLRLSADDIRATGDGVLIFGRVDGRAGELTIRRRVVWVWQLRDGKVSSIRVSDLPAER
jgi:ketosteroid isomerase-like protein